jgi:SAM-dependent methyltransferase
MKIILRYIWGHYPVLFIRKVFNTFRPVVWFAGLFYDVSTRKKIDAEIWEEEGHYQSDFYLTLGDVEQRFIDYVVENTEKTDRILDVCCNQGRFLFELKKKGYFSLFGFDIMGPAINKLIRNPEYLPETIEVEHRLAQDYFNNKRNDSYDWAITYTATIELINPEFDIFYELGRTVKKGMFLVLSENGHSYPRFYRLLHKLNGFEICSVTSITDGAVLIHSVKKQ